MRLLKTGARLCAVALSLVILFGSSRLSFAQDPAPKAIEKNAGGKEAEEKGDTYDVTIQKIQDRKAVVATIETVRESQARARISGTLSLLTVKEGDYVKAGEKIAVVGDPKLALQNQGLRARIQAAEAAFAKAKQDNARAEELRRTGYATVARVDETRAAFDIAANNLKAAEAEQQVVLQQSIEGAVLAPSSGRVLKVPVSTGSVVMAGEVIAVMSQENYILRLELPERHARFLKVGDPVLIGARGLAEDKTEDLKTGTVQLIYPEIRDGRVVADVRADALGDYFVGERARVYVATGSRDAILVPKRFLTRRAGVDFVKLASGAEIVVQTGQEAEGNVEILAGLNAGDKVVMP